MKATKLKADLMTITIQLSPEAEERLRQQATQKGAKLEDYLSELAQQWANGGVSSTAQPVPQEKSPEQRVAEFLAWVDSHSHITAVADDSRESIYEGCGE